MFCNFTKLLIPGPLLLLSIGATSLFPQPSAARTSRQTSSVAQSAEWNRYTLKDRTFSVLFPTIPAMSSYSGKFWDTDKRRLRNVIGAYSQGVGYSINVYQVRQSLTEFIANYSQTFGWSFKREVTVSGVQGKEYGFESDDGKGVTQFFLLDDRVYVFSAMGSRLGNLQTDLPKFFESIRFDRLSEALEIEDGPGDQPDATGTTDSSGERVLTVKEVTQKARVVSKPEPTYTDEARNNQTRGTVVLRAIMSSSGQMTQISVHSSLPHGLTEKAISAALQIRFIPAIKDGKFVSTYIQLEYNFNLY